MSQVCFSTTSYIMTTVIMISVVVFLAAISYYYKDKLDQLGTIQDLKTLIQKQNLKSQYSPITVIKQQPIEHLPERRYIGRNDFSDNSQQVGFIFNTSGERYPLYENRRDTRYYYHIIDNTRNGIRIIIETRRNEQLSDDEVITIPELGGSFTVKLYEYSGNRYNPFI